VRTTLVSDARSDLRCINQRLMAVNSLTFLKRVAAMYPFNRGMELIANAIAGISPRGWIVIAVLTAVVMAVLIAIGIAWLLAYAD